MAGMTTVVCSMTRCRRTPVWPGRRPPSREASAEQSGARRGHHASTVFRGLVQAAHPDDFFALSGRPSAVRDAAHPGLGCRSARMAPAGMPKPNVFHRMYCFCHPNRRRISFLAGHIYCDRYGNTQYNISKILREPPKFGRSKSRDCKDN